MLPQFTLNARITFFMMVMFATATTASLKKSNDVVIMLKNHERALHVNAGGKVTATDISLAQFFSMESVGDIFSDTFKIALYAKEVGRYLCFKRGKLVGMKNLTRDCHFIESLDHGYFLYANAYNPLWRVGFTKGLKPVGPRHWKRPQTLKRACFLFVKISAEHFDRSRFTTTTTTTPRTMATKATAGVILKEGQGQGEEQGYKLHDSKASIIDSNSNNYKRTKSAADADNGNRQFLINSESGGSNHQWPEKESLGQRQRHRKRKHHAKLIAANSNGGSGSLQPKNLVRHHHDQGNGKRRRRQHLREERERKLRLQNQRRQHEQQQQQQRNNKTVPEPTPSATYSATPSVAATTLAATASLAPSALNIVAMLAAGRRKRGRRKKPGDSNVTNVSSNSGHHQAMDLQLVAQSPLQAQSQYDRVRTNGTKGGHAHNVYHEHNYHQKHQHSLAPVNFNSSPNKNAINKQQQNHKYSNIITSSQLTDRSRSNSSSSSSSRRSSHRINSNNFSHNFNLNLNRNDNVNNVNLNNNNNNNNDYNNDNDNDNINAIHALPKNYLSRNNFNNEYLMQQTTRSLTDFNKKQQQLKQLSHTAYDEQQKKHSQISRTYHSHTSHYDSQEKSRDKNYKHDSDSDNDDDSDSNSDDSKDEDKDGEYMNKKNSNRLLVNNKNISDNNLQQEEHLVKRLKLNYLDRIRSHNFNLKSKTNNKNYLNNIQKQQQKQKHQHYYNKNNSPISSTTKTTNEHFLVLKNFKKRNETNNSNNNSKNDNSSNSSSRSIKNRSKRSTFSSLFTSSNNRNHSHRRRTKRHYFNCNITNNNNNKNNNYKINVNEKRKYNNVNINYNNNKNNAKSRNSNSSSSNSSSSNSNSKSSSSSSSDSSHISKNNKNIYVLQNLNDNKVNSFKNSKQKYFNILIPSTAASSNSKLLTLLHQQKLIKQQLQQQQNIMKHYKNPNKYNYNNYKNYENEYDDDDEGGKLKGIQNKYEKIIVQYRSVFNCLETMNLLTVDKQQVGK